MSSDANMTSAAPQDASATDTAPAAAPALASAAATASAAPTPAPAAAAVPLGSFTIGELHRGGSQMMPLVQDLASMHACAFCMMRMLNVKQVKAYQQSHEVRR